MNPFVSDLVDLAIHDSGWHELPNGDQISKLPVWDTRHEVFGRPGHGRMREWLEANGMAMPDVEDYQQLHRDALHIDPYFLPLPEMIAAAGVPKPWVDAAGRDSHMMANYRSEYMRSLNWAELHDDQVFHRLMRAGWKGEPVANGGKHWGIRNGLIVLTGWWDKDGNPLQIASTFHQREPGYGDYGSTTHAKRAKPTDVSELDTDPSPPLYDWRSHDGTIGERCCGWLGAQFGFDPREIPGPEHDPRILSYSKHCYRGGHMLTVDIDGEPLWRGGVPLSAPSDEWPWCAMARSAAVCAVLRPGERPPHGARVSCRELCEDGKTAGTLHVVGDGYEPQPGDAAIYERAGQNPLAGGQGHVRTLIQNMGGMGTFIGGNEGDRFMVGPAPMVEPKLVAWIAAS